MNEQEKLRDLIDNANKPTEIEWIYEVDSYLHENKEITKEALDLIRSIKSHQNTFHDCDKMVAWLRQLYKKKYDQISLPSISKRNQIFVAMKFSKGMNSYYEEGYKPVIQSLNYAAMRIDEKDFTGSIIGEIVKEIPDSVALIADLTGNRGGVYYEAGIARGLQLCNHPIKLLLTCQQDFFDNEKVHFDVSGDNILLYSGCEDLKQKLQKRLFAVLKGAER